MIAHDQVFSDATVYLDGNSFYRCKFERCTVIINGYMGCTLVDPRFIALAGLTGAIMISSAVTGFCPVHFLVNRFYR